MDHVGMEQDNDAPCTAEQIAAIVRAAEHRVGYIRWLAEKLRKTSDEAIRLAAADELERLVSQS